MPLPERNVQTSSCTSLLYKLFIQAVLCTGMGMNVTAHSPTSRQDSYFVDAALQFGELGPPVRVDPEVRPLSYWGGVER